MLACLLSVSMGFFSSHSCFINLISSCSSAYYFDISVSSKSIFCRHHSTVQFLRNFPEKFITDKGLYFQKHYSVKRIRSLYKWSTKNIHFIASYFKHLSWGKNLHGFMIIEFSIDYFLREFSQLQLQQLWFYAEE